MPSLQQIARLQVETQGFEKARRDVEGLSRASGSLTAAVETSSASIMEAGRKLEAWERRNVQGAKAAADHARDMGMLDRMLAAGSISAERYARNVAIVEQKHLMAQRAANQNALAIQAHSNVVALNRGQIQQLSFQLNDMATMLASGASPFQILATQGGQVFQIFQQGQGGVGGSLRAFGNTLAGLITPARLMGGAIVAAGVAGVAAWNAYDNKLKDVQRSLNGLGGGAGATSARIFDMAASMSKAGPVSFGQAVAGGSAFAAAGVTPELYGPLNEAALRFSRGFGTSMEDAQKKLSEAFADPSQGIADLAKTFGPFGVEVTKNIQRMQSLGQLEDAQVALYGLLNDRLRGVVDTSGYLERAWASIRGAGSNAFGAIGKIGQPLTPAEQFRRASQDEMMASRFGNTDVVVEARKRRVEAESRLSKEELEAERKRAQALSIRFAWLEETNRRISDLAQSSAQGTVARTASEKLAVEQERLRREAIYDQSRISTLATEVERARTLAIAEATRALADYKRNAADEAFLGGATTPRDEFIRRMQLDRRTLREQTEGLIPDNQWRSQVKLGDESRAQPLGGLRLENYGPFGYNPYAISRNNPLLERRILETEGRRYLGEPGSRIAQPAATFRELTVGRRRDDAPGDIDQSRLRNWDDNQTNRLFADVRRNIEANSEVLRINAETFGKSTFEVARASEQVRLENEVRRMGISDLARYREKIAELAELEGRLAEARERSAKVQAQIIEGLDAVRGTFSDAVSSPLKALARGESMSKSLQQVRQRSVDKLIDMSTKQLMGGLLGDMGKPGGGLFGGLLGGLMGQQNTAMMNVNASVVNLGGAGLGFSGGSGGLFGGLFGGSSGFDNSAALAASGAGDDWGGSSGGLLSSLFSLFSANGNVFMGGNVMAFANGGVVGGPTVFPMTGGRTGLMGEAGTEGIMPLRRGPDGRLGVSAYGGASGGSGKTTVNVHNYGNSQVRTEDRGEGPDGRMLDVYIEEKVAEVIAGGRADSAMSGRYGRKPTPVFR